MTDALWHYMQQQPLVGLLIGALVVGFVVSLVGKLIKLAAMVGAVLLVSAFFTHRQAVEQWQHRGTELVQETRAAAMEGRRQATKVLAAGKLALDIRDAAQSSNEE